MIFSIIRMAMPPFAFGRAYRVQACLRNSGRICRVWLP